MQVYPYPNSTSFSPKRSTMAEHQFEFEGTPSYRIFAQPDQRGSSDSPDFRHLRRTLSRRTKALVLTPHLFSTFP